MGSQLFADRFPHGAICQFAARATFALIRSVQFKDYYKVLGVPKTATQDEIRKAYRKLAREFHPDVAKDKKAAEAKFKEINEANEVIGDPSKRAKYDELGADWNQPGRQGPPPGWEQSFGGGGFEFRGGGGGGGFSDFFEAFFGGGGARAQKRSAARRGQDVEFELPVSVEEVLGGAKKSFTVTLDGSPQTITVTVPKGVRAGQRIRLTGKGGPGTGGGPAGDMYLLVQIAAHADYRIDGSDLICPVAVPVTTAVLGGEIAVPTPDGNVKLKIAAGTQPGRKLRIKGRGLPNGKDTRGDFYAELKVALPTTLTDAQRKLWEKLVEA